MEVYSKYTSKLYLVIIIHPTMCCFWDSEVLRVKDPSTDFFFLHSLLAVVVFKFLAMIKQPFGVGGKGKNLIFACLF